MLIHRHMGARLHTHTAATREHPIWWQVYNAKAHEAQVPMGATSDDAAPASKWPSGREGTHVFTSVNELD